jgi:serine/threonine protein kinase
VLHGRYSLFEVVGQGRSGVVRRGYDHVLKREVAVKTMADSPYARWEVQLLGQLGHAHIAEFYDAIIEKGKLHLIMELCPGGTVRQKRLTLPELIHIGIQGGEALRHLHATGFVHCDVKPSHLAISGDGRVKLVDFGTAAALGEPALGGTARYMAPELKEAPAAHPRLDVYGLGKTLLTLAKENRLSLPKRLKAALRRACSPRPEERWQAMAAFLEELKACATLEEQPSKPSLSYLRGGAAALSTLGILTLGVTPGMYPEVFTLLLGPGIVGFSALYSPFAAAVALAVVVLPCVIVT